MNNNPMRMSMAMSAILASTLVMLPRTRSNPRVKEPDAMVALIDTVKAKIPSPAPKLSEADHDRLDKAEAKRQLKAEKRIRNKFEV